MSTEGQCRYGSLGAEIPAMLGQNLKWTLGVICFESTVQFNLLAPTFPKVEIFCFNETKTLSNAQDLLEQNILQEENYTKLKYANEPNILLAPCQ